MPGRKGDASIMTRPVLPVRARQTAGARRPIAEWFDRATIPWQSIGAVLLLLAVWEASVWFWHVPGYVLPPPSRVATTLVRRAGIVFPEALTTFGEMLGGLG